MKIQVNVNDIQIIKENLLNENEYNIHHIDFEFSEEYTIDLVKIALFTLNDKSYKVVINNNSCNIPSEVLTNQGFFILGVYAFHEENNVLIERFSPSPIRVSVLDGSYISDENTKNSEPLTPTDKEQILQEILNIQNEQITQNENISNNAQNIKKVENLIPTKTSQLQNDSNFVNETQMGNAINEEATLRKNNDDNLQNQIDFIINQLPKVKGNGTVINLKNSINTQFLKFGIKGNSEIVNNLIVSAGENGTITEKIINKNLWNGVTRPSLFTGRLDSNGNLVSTNSWRTMYFPALPNIQYTISNVSRTNNAVFEWAYDKDMHPINSVGRYNNYTFTAPTNTAFLGISVDSNERNNFQIEANSIATPFVTHQEQIYSIPVQQPMRNVGTVRDEFIKLNNNWYERHNIAYIESYNGETITTDYISTTGGLDIGASVQYVATTPLDLPCTQEQITILENLPLSYSEQTNIYSEDSIPAYVESETFLDLNSLVNN